MTEWDGDPDKLPKADKKYIIFAGMLNAEKVSCGEIAEAHGVPKSECFCIEWGMSVSDVIDGVDARHCKYLRMDEGIPKKIWASNPSRYRMFKQSEEKK